MATKTIDINAIALSDRTKELIECRARLGELYCRITTLMEEDKMVSYKNYEQRFDNSFVEFDASLGNILSARMNVMMVSSEYKNL